MVVENSLKTAKTWTPGSKIWVTDTTYMSNKIILEFYCKGENRGTDSMLELIDNRMLCIFLQTAENMCLVHYLNNV